MLIFKLCPPEAVRGSVAAQPLHVLAHCHVVILVLVLWDLFLKVARFDVCVLTKLDCAVDVIEHLGDTAGVTAHEAFACARQGTHKWSIQG
eukprot:355126-Chlamydomonas_euryale.AAC.4